MRGKYFVEFNGGRLRFPCDRTGQVDTCALPCIEAKRNYRQAKGSRGTVVQGIGRWQAGTYREVVVGSI